MAVSIQPAVSVKLDTTEAENVKPYISNQLFPHICLFDWVTFKMLNAKLKKTTTRKQDKQ